MKIFKKMLLVASLGMTLSAFQVHSVDAATDYTVKPGDTMWKISQRYGVPLISLQKTNNEWDNNLYIGQRLTIPTMTSAERTLLAQLVHAEAAGEPFSGKVAVATVVFNRVDSSLFPNDVKSVIYQIDQGHYAFSPVQDGRIHNTPTSEDYRAIDEAIAFRGQGNGSLYFYNPQKSTSEWIFSRPVTVRIGDHVFAK